MINVLLLLFYSSKKNCIISKNNFYFIWPKLGLHYERHPKSLPLPDRPEGKWIRESNNYELWDAGHCWRIWSGVRPSTTTWTRLESHDPLIWSSCLTITILDKSIVIMRTPSNRCKDHQCCSNLGACWLGEFGLHPILPLFSKDGVKK